MAAGDKVACKRRCATTWSDLQPDILRLISTYVTSTWDFVRFRGVCASWRSAASPVDRPPQVPSLLLPYDYNTISRSFLDPLDWRVHTINIREAISKILCGTPYGWLVMIGDKTTNNGTIITVSLLNPITRAQIVLPPITEHLNTYRVKAALSADPSSSQPKEEVFLAILFYFFGLYVYKLGKTDAWRVINLRVRSDPNRTMVDLAFFDGSFFVVDRCKGITVYRTKTDTKKYNAPPSKRWTYYDDSFHLVESSGDLLLLHRRNEKVKFVDKLDRSNTRKFKWVRIQESFGGRALFVSLNQTSVSVYSQYFTGRGGDVMYFAGEKKDNKSYKDAIICISDIDAGSSTPKQSNDWEGSRKACLGWKCLNGLAWIVPSPC